MTGSSKPPISKKIPGYSFPGFRREELSNGIPVYMLEDNSQPLLRMKLGFKMGAYDETKGGLAYVTAKMLKRGTGKLSTTEISEKIDFLGSHISPHSHWDDTSFNITTLAENFGKSLEIFSECLFNATFKEDELGKYRNKHIAMIQSDMADPEYLSQTAFNSVVYYDTPYAHSLTGSIPSISKITREDCKRWHERILNDSEIFIIVSGNFGRGDVLTLIDKHLSRLKNRQSSSQSGFHKKKPHNTRVIISEKNESNQTTLRIGKRTIDKNHPDYPLLQMINTIFGGYFLSRLNHILREQMGLTYGISSYPDARKNASALVIGTGINKNATVKSIDVVLAEMKKITDTPVSTAELKRARQYSLGSFIRLTETHHQASSMLYALEVNCLNHDYYDKLYNRIKSMTVEELFTAQQKYFKPDNMVISATGDLKYLRKKLKQYGEIEEYSL